MKDRKPVWVKCSLKFNFNQQDVVTKVGRIIDLVRKINFVRLVTSFNVVIICPTAEAHHVLSTLLSQGAVEAQQGFIINKGIERRTHGKWFINDNTSFTKFESRNKFLFLIFTIPRNDPCILMNCTLMSRGYFVLTFNQYQNSSWLCSKLKWLHLNRKKLSKTTGKICTSVIWNQLIIRL